MSGLDGAYRAQLQAALTRERAAWHTIPWQTRAMLAWIETHAGGRLPANQVARTWIWSDLHLNHTAIIWAGSRPFWSAAEMRKALLEAWQETVAETSSSASATSPCHRSPPSTRSWRRCRGTRS